MKYFVMALFILLVSSTNAICYEFCMTIPDQEVANLATAIAANHNYQEEISDGVPNPETKAAFAKRMIRQYLVSEYVNYFGIVPGEAAKQQAIDAAKAIIEQ